MVHVDVQLLPGALANRETMDVAVVIDILRMTTTATWLFAEGLEALWVVAEVDDARSLAKARGLLLLGERQNRALPGFDGGNSPLEYRRAKVGGRGAVLCTSNGSKAVEAVSGAAHLLLGAAVNARAVARRALAVAEREIVLVCAGTNGAFSLDDALGAACILDELRRVEPTLELGDGALMTLATLRGAPALEEGLRSARHGRLLLEMGFAGDLAFAARVNSLSAVAEKHGHDPARFVCAP